MLGGGHKRRKHQPVRVQALRCGMPAQGGLDGRLRHQQPQHAVRHPVQDAAPAHKHVLGDLVALVEAGIDKGLLRQADIAAAGGGFRMLAQLVGGLVAQRQLRQMLVEVGRIGQWRDYRVGNQVVHPTGAQCAGIGQPQRLDRCGAQRHQLYPRTGGVAAHVDQHRHAVILDSLRLGGKAHRAAVDKAVGGRLDALSQGRAVIVTTGVQEHLKALSVQVFEGLHQQQAGGMGAEVSRHQANTTTPFDQPARRQRMAVLIDRQTVLRLLLGLRRHLPAHLVRQALRLQLRSAAVQHGIVVHCQQAERTEGLASGAGTLPGQCRQQALAVRGCLLPVAGPGGIVSGIHRSTKVGWIDDRHGAKAFGRLGKLPQCRQ